MIVRKGLIDGSYIFCSKLIELDVINLTWNSLNYDPLQPKWIQFIQSGLESNSTEVWACLEWTPVLNVCVAKSNAM